MSRPVPLLTATVDGRRLRALMSAAGRPPQADSDIVALDVEVELHDGAIEVHTTGVW